MPPRSLTSRRMIVVTAVATGLHRIADYNCRTHSGSITTVLAEVVLAD